MGAVFKLANGAEIYWHEGKPLPKELRYYTGKITIEADGEETPIIIDALDCSTYTGIPTGKTKAKKP